MESVHYVECPRDAWQSFSRFIPTEEKVAYLKALLEAGFQHLDLTSLVSPRWVPQMKDAEEVLAALPPPGERTYLAIIANEKGLERALAIPHLTAVGYPFSISETFQIRNTNRTPAQSWLLVETLVRDKGRLKLVVYVSMAFGNPYGDPWSPEGVVRFAERLKDLGVDHLVLADTDGVADAERIGQTLQEVVQRVGPVGAHLHSHPQGVEEKVEKALSAGVRWLEGALAGQGGCPFAGDERVGNLPTEVVIPHLERKGFKTGVMLHRLPELSQKALQLKLRYG